MQNFRNTILLYHHRRIMLLITVITGISEISDLVNQGTKIFKGKSEVLFRKGGVVCVIVPMTQKITFQNYRNNTDKFNIH